MITSIIPSTPSGDDNGNHGSQLTADIALAAITHIESAATQEAMKHVVEQIPMDSKGAFIQWLETTARQFCYTYKDIEDLQKSKQADVQSFENAFHITVGMLINTLRGRFKNPEEFPFHSVNHTYDVAWRTLQQLSVIKNKLDELSKNENNPNLATLITDEHYIEAILLALGHDIVQNGHINEKGEWIRHRGRNEQDTKHWQTQGINNITAGNEEASAIEMTQIINTPTINGIPILSKIKGLSASEIKKAYAATYPDFSLEALSSREGAPQGLKIKRPDLTKQTPLVPALIAYADLPGACGLKHFEYWNETSIDGWREINRWATKLVNDGIENIKPEDTFKIAESVIKWKELGPGFIGWQRRLFAETLPGVINNLINSDSNKRTNTSEEVTNAILSEYLDFQLNIDEMNAHLENFKKKYNWLRNPEEAPDIGHKLRLLTLTKLLEEMGYAKEKLEKARDNIVKNIERDLLSPYSRKQLVGQEAHTN